MRRVLIFGVVLAVAEEEAAGVAPHRLDRVLVAARDDKLAAGADDKGRLVHGHLHRPLHHVEHLDRSAGGRAAPRTKACFDELRVGFTEAGGKTSTPEERKLPSVKTVWI